MQWRHLGLSFNRKMECRRHLMLLKRHDLSFCFAFLDFKKSIVVEVNSSASAIGEVPLPKMEDSKIYPIQLPKQTMNSVTEFSVWPKSVNCRLLRCASVLSVSRHQTPFSSDRPLSAESCVCLKTYLYACCSLVVLPCTVWMLDLILYGWLILSCWFSFLCSRRRGTWRGYGRRRSDSNQTLSNSGEGISQGLKALYEMLHVS